MTPVGEDKAKIFDYNLIVLRDCVVSFVDGDGVLHSVQVTAESVNEAAVHGLAELSKSWAGAPRFMTAITVEVSAPTIKHQVTVQQLKQWMKAAASGPKEALLKNRLKDVFGG